MVPLVSIVIVVLPFQRANTFVPTPELSSLWCSFLLILRIVWHLCCISSVHLVRYIAIVSNSSAIFIPSWYPFSGVCPVNTHVNNVNTNNGINQAQHKNETRHNTVAVDDMTKLDNTKQYQEEEEDRKKNSKGKDNCVSMYVKWSNRKGKEETILMKIALDSGNELIYPVIATNVVDELKIMGVIPRTIKLKHSKAQVSSAAEEDMSMRGICVTFLL